MQSEFQFTNPALLALEYNINKEFSSDGDEPIAIEVKTKTEVHRAENNNEAFVILKVSIGEKSEKKPFYVYAEEGASFKWTDSNFGKSDVDGLLEQNAPALLLSYLRPTIAMVTSASQFSAYNIPFMNFTKSTSSKK